MIHILEGQFQPAPRRSPNLLLHCGAQAVDRRQVDAAETPISTTTWTPIPHHALISQVEQTLKANGLTVGHAAHSMTRSGMRYFGLLEVQNQDLSLDYSWVLGLRNSHDRRFPAGIVAGAQVFVCDNLSFSGEINLARRHTRFINRDLPGLVQTAIGRLADHWHHQDVRISSYKEAKLRDSTVHDLVIRASDLAICANRHIPHILREWRAPRHREFEPRNAWSLFNGFTESLKGNLAELPRRTEALHGLLDNFVGLPTVMLN